jgi:hypothetical protein
MIQGTHDWNTSYKSLECYANKTSVEVKWFLVTREKIEVDCLTYVGNHKVDGQGYGMMFMLMLEAPSV